jgi:hypothetical protein
MEMIKCSQKTKHVRQPSEYDCKVQDLMTSTIYVIALWVPFLGDLPKVSWAEAEIEESMSTNPRSIYSGTSKIKSRHQKHPV